MSMCQTTRHCSECAGMLCHEQVHVVLYLIIQERNSGTHQASGVSGKAAGSSHDSPKVLTMTCTLQ